MLMMECRETLVESPLAFEFSTLLHIQDPVAPSSEKRSLSWGGVHSLDDGVIATGATPPLIKVGSGEINPRKKIKKNRPSLLKKHMELCVEQLITRQFNEEEAELATLSLDFSTQVEEQHIEISPRCPAPEPFMMQSRPKNKILSERKHRRASLEVTTYPFGLRPRARRKKRFLPPDFEMGSSDESESESDISPPSSPLPRKGLPVLKKSFSTDTGCTVAIPTLDFAKLSALRDRGSLLSPHPSPPRSPSSPNVSKPDCAKYRSIESSPRSAFVKPSSA